jgi:acetyl esterase/lipase
VIVRCLIPGGFIKTSTAVLILLLASAPAFAQRQRRSRGPEPDHGNVKYGPHQRNVFDLWQAKSNDPTPLVIYIHGGGFRGGNKNSVSGALVKGLLEKGVSVAAIHYRLTDTAPFPAAMHDAGRALQFLRHKAGEYNLDKRKFAATGGSAGAGISLWLAFHDDLADPGNKDPVLRESTRLCCVLPSNVQCSYDHRRRAGARAPGAETLLRAQGRRTRFQEGTQALRRGLPDHPCHQGRSPRPDDLRRQRQAG